MAPGRCHALCFVRLNGSEVTIKLCTHCVLYRFVQFANGCGPRCTGPEWGESATACPGGTQTKSDLAHLPNRSSRKNAPALSCVCHCLDSSSFRGWSALGMAGEAVRAWTVQLRQPLTRSNCCDDIRGCLVCSCFYATSWLLCVVELFFNRPTIPIAGRPQHGDSGC